MYNPNPGASAARRHPGYGKGQHTIDLGTLLRADPETLSTRIVAAVRSPGYAPPLLPDVALEVNRLAQSPDTDFRQVAAALSREPMLAGQVLQIASSPAYGGRKMATLDDAVGRLGTNGIRNLVMQVVLDLRVFRAPHFSDLLKSVRGHAVATAHVAHAVARRTSVDPNQAFLAGLMHEVGIAGAVHVIVEAFGRRTPPDVRQFWSSISDVHGEVGGVMAAHWGIAGRVALAIEGHHDRPNKGQPALLTSAVTVACHIASQLGRGMRLGDDVVDRSPVDVVRAAGVHLGLNADAMRALFAEAGALFELLDD
ncbi:MAG: HDOD domain-containing protein [Myxococcales bacterium]|nr:HDOD domain-containing protein [Myxococcales bacterium]